MGRGVSPSVATAGARVRAADARGWLDGVALCVTLAKPRITLLVVFTAVVACLLAGGQPTAGQLLLLAVGGGLASAGAAAINHYVDRDIDALMVRTRNRPLVSGRIEWPEAVPMVGVALLLVGSGLAGVIHPAVGGWTLAGGLIYAGVYTLWLKRTTVLNIVIGGFAGSTAVLAGWSVVEPALGLVPWLLAALVFAWTPAHFWSLALVRRADYQRANIPMLPVLVGARSAAAWTGLHIVATLLLSLWLGLAASLGPLYWLAAVAAGVGFGYLGGAFMVRPETGNAWRLFKWSGPYLGTVFLGVLADATIWPVLVAAVSSTGR